MKYLCGRCIHIDVCFMPRSTGCVEECKYFKEMPNHLLKQTNEEWFCGLSTEEKAKVIVDLGRKQHFPKDIEIEICEQWLKEVHKE